MNERIYTQIGQLVVQVLTANHQIEQLQAEVDRLKAKYEPEESSEEGD